jgi:hypothetical protein
MNASSLPKRRMASAPRRAGLVLMGNLVGILKGS